MRILLISSNSRTRHYIQRVLEDHTFIVDVERDFISGIKHASVNPYKIAVVEHAAQGISAETFVEEIRDRGRLFPIFVLVPEDQKALGTACLNKGADDFMTTPISVTEFMARVRCLLRRPAHIAHEEIRIGSIRIDRRKRTVHKAKREIFLTLKEFAVLEILAMNEGGIVSKGEIIEHAWGESDDIKFEGALETHIYMLRQKLDGGKSNLIQTAFGRGYRLS